MTETRPVFSIAPRLAGGAIQKSRSDHDTTACLLSLEQRLVAGEDLKSKLNMANRIEHEFRR